MRERDYDKLALKKFDMNSIVPNATVLLLGRRRSGKCLAKGTKVCLADGSLITVEDINESHQLLGDDFSPRKVLGTTSGVGELYKVLHLDSGDFYVVNRFHVLSLKVRSDQQTTIDISIEDFLSLNLEIKSSLVGYKADGSVSEITVTEQGIGDYSGFEIDCNHRFVLGNGIVTHNSWLVRDIFYHHKQIPMGLIFSGTEEANTFFGSFVPDSFIHSDYDPELVEKVFVGQKKKIRKAKVENLSKDGCLPSNRFFIVLDDMLHDANSWKREKTIQSIFFNGRHYNFFFVLTMQYPLGIPPALRSNIDYVFVFNEPSVKNRKKIYDDYAGMLPSFDYFCNILDSCTRDHECLVIKTSGNSNDLRDQLFWYKAQEHDGFKVGHPAIWKFHQKNYKQGYDEEQDQDREKADLMKKYSRSKKLKVLVSRETGDVVKIQGSD
jgi:hypothetical protein